jgi:hypothetical protein
MPTFELVSLIVLGGAAWFWFDTLHARQIGIQAARQACATEQLQFLDDTVASSGLGFARNGNGQLVMKRVYAFEYSDTGDNRRRGNVVLLGHRVTVIHIGLRPVGTASLH